MKLLITAILLLTFTSCTTLTEEQKKEIKERNQELRLLKKRSSQGEY